VSCLDRVAGNFLLGNREDVELNGFVELVGWDRYSLSLFMELVGAPKNSVRTFHMRYVCGAPGFHQFQDCAAAALDYDVDVHELLVSRHFDRWLEGGAGHVVAISQHRVRVRSPAKLHAQ
jgi:hypothetical protein